MKKLKLSDKINIKTAYDKKIEEYSQLSLDELKELYENSSKDKTKRIGGIYKIALLDNVSKKLQEQSIKEAIEISDTIVDTKDNIIELNNE